MGGAHLTMTEEEEYMERERKLEDVYKRYFDARPGLEQESDELYDLYQNDKISFEEYRKKSLELGKNTTKKL